MMEVFDTWDIQVRTQPGEGEVWDQMEEELDDRVERNLPGHDVH